MLPAAAAAAAFALPTGQFLGENIVDPVASAAARSLGWKRDESELASLSESFRQEDMARAVVLREQRLMRADMDNAERLARINPGLVKQILAGRRLPRGAVVIGGKPRTDALMELARAMSQGAYTEQPKDPLLALAQSGVAQ
ncbi:MAG: hypothetical protein ACK4Y5_20750 [Acetobacteraceae bacterium]|jgi:hypothetical protein